MQHRVGALEVCAVGVAVGIVQVGQPNVRHGQAVAGGLGDVQADQIVALPERLDHALGDVAGGAGQHDPFPAHFQGSLCW